MFVYLSFSSNLFLLLLPNISRGFIAFVCVCVWQVCVCVSNWAFTCLCVGVVRFDYEGLDPRAAFYLMRDLEAVISDKAFTSQKFAVGDHLYSVEKADNFEYIDPVDGTVARNQVSVGWERDGKARQM